MRRTTYVAATLAALLTLTACSGDADDPEPADTGTASDTAAASDETLESITVEGEPGEQPTVDVPTGFDVEDAAAHVVSPGDGDTLEAGDLALVNYVSIDGASGEVAETTYEGDTLEPLQLGETTVPALVEALTGEQVGARVLFATPHNPVMAIEIMDSAPTRAVGDEVDPVDGLPTVTLAENGEPSIEPADGEEPSELIVQPTIEGDGKVVEEGDNVLVHYSGWLWDGTPFDSSWSRNTLLPVPVGQGQVIEGWDTGLQGLTVGSQAILVVPSELGYGDEDQDVIPGGSTLVFVVDVIYAS